MKPPIIRAELIAVLLLLAVGFGLRAAWPARIAVEHFDEGVYASDLYSPLTGERYPDQHLYAPPLLPFLCYWATILGGPHAVVWINIVAGSLTLVVVWAMVREWWGPPSALAALAVLAFNDFHIAYSRTVLTDPLLCLWMTAGVWMGWRAILYGGARNIVAAGVFAGLAWWTKYNGWLTLAITGAGTAGWIAMGSLLGRLRQSKRPTIAENRGRDDHGTSDATIGSPTPPATVGLLRWLATATIAVLVWSPWLWELQKYGGYSAVARNHAGYFAGLTEWLPNAQQQLAAQWHYLKVQTGLGILLAIITPALCFGAPLLRTPLNQGSPVERLAKWIALAWLIGLALAAPLYHPYPRLALPLVICLLLWLGKSAAAGISATHPSEATSGKIRQGLKLLALLLVGAISANGILERRAPWDDRTSFQTIAKQVVTGLKSEHLDGEFEGYRCVVYVVAEPGLFFHLASAQSDSPVGHLTQAASDYGMAQPGGHRAPIPAYVLIGPHADHEEADRLVAAGRLSTVAELEYHPSDLVLLDEMPAWELKRSGPRPSRLVRLFHVKAD